MAFSTPKDYFSLSGTDLKLQTSTENKSTQVAEGQDERGDYVARDVAWGVIINPECTYTLATDLSKAISLGQLSTSGTDKIILTKLSIKTAAGKAPEITASGESIQAAGTESSTYDLGTLTAEVRHKAQIIGSAFTLTGTDCKLVSCDWVAECTLTRATVKGETVSHDVSGGKLTVTASIVAYGATAPTITEGADWDITSSLTSTNPDGDYDTYTVTLTKSLTGTDPV